MSKYGEIIFYAKYLEPQLQAVKNVLLLHLAWILRIIEYLQFQIQIIYLNIMNYQHLTYLNTRFKWYCGFVDLNLVIWWTSRI